MGTVPVGRHQVVFSGLMGTPEINCKMLLKRGDKVQIVAVPEGVAVTSDNFNPETPDDIYVQTPGFCRQ